MPESIEDREVEVESVRMKMPYKMTMRTSKMRKAIPIITVTIYIPLLIILIFNFE